MSNPKSKPKTASKPVEPKAKYAIGQKVFVIISHRGKPEELAECKVESRTIVEYKPIEAGKNLGTLITHSYSVVSHDARMNVRENEIYPSFQSAANKFAEAFTTLLK
jgi:hypothetical protein